MYIFEELYKKNNNYPIIQIDTKDNLIIVIDFIRNLNIYEFYEKENYFSLVNKDFSIGNLIQAKFFDENILQFDNISNFTISKKNKYPENDCDKQKLQVLKFLILNSFKFY